ncbi:MAG: cell division protease FtsH [Candidatus Berkelbacteria bacterium Licking1014_2]|uniref:ATP-dependent zinc metalloprotease FtsH n=1 Tax=Candidatus Berkelbacteria bacterium Licking1014_2 TaxID=2017146 RepID=A0A554LVY7_9BACT|nr:MAG: cell division protease FtsH [Candidatus Berkelbacteria bacterium Licking1014_2]
MKLEYKRKNKNGNNQVGWQGKISCGKIVVYGLLTFFLLWSVYNFYSEKQQPSINTIPISELVARVNDNQIASLEVSGNTIKAEDKNGQKLKSFKEEGVGIYDYGIDSQKTKITVKNDDTWLGASGWLSIFLPVILMSLIFFWILRSAQGVNSRAMSFGKTTARLFNPSKKNTTFADVAGLIEPKQELTEVVDFLRYPERFTKLKAEIPKGVLLIGAPGTGKTLLAKAVAGEANVPFFSISASEFVEMFVGVGAARVRDLFAKAKRNAPAILFIDEMDAVGRQRGTGLGGSHDEREQTLNQVLVEMDGFETDARVIVMAATNRPDVLDPALLRPGRFDRRVVLDLPDINDREEILKIHTKNKPLSGSVKLREVARSTVGFSGAELKNVANEAAILAGRHNQKQITHYDFEQAVEKVMLGPERKSRQLSKYEKELAACHEVGHALVSHILPDCDPVQKVSIVSRGMALGYTWNLPEVDRHIYSRHKFIDDLAMMLGGRAAEKVLFREITTGSQNDLERATKLAREMITVYGMSQQLGPVTLGQKEELVFLGRELGERKNHSDTTATQIDNEIKKILNEAEKTATKVIIANLTLAKKLAAVLLTKETIAAEEFNHLTKNAKNTIRR